MLLIFILCILLIVLLSIVVDSIRYGISPMPCNQKAIKAALSFIPKDYKGYLYECGSGFGWTCVKLSRHCPSAKILAYEGSPFPCLISHILIRIFRCKNVQVFYENFLYDRFFPGSIIFCYLAVKNMEKVYQKLKKEQFEGNLISYTFALPHVKPTKTYQVNDLFYSKVYYYEI